MEKVKKHLENESKTQENKINIQCNALINIKIIMSDAKDDNDQWKCKIIFGSWEIKDSPLSGISDSGVEKIGKNGFQKIK